MLVVEELHWWNDDGLKLKCSEKTLPHHKSHNDWLGIEPDLRCVRPATNLLWHDRASESVATSVSLNNQMCRTELSRLHSNNVFNDVFPGLSTDVDYPHAHILHEVLQHQLMIFHGVTTQNTVYRNNTHRETLKLFFFFFFRWHNSPLRTYDSLVDFSSPVF